MEHPEIRGLSDWRPLARGACADIWEARQQSLDRLVAVKIYRAELDEGGRRRFLREAAAAGRLPYHPGIVTVHGAGRLPDGRPYLILELFSSGSLTSWLPPENRPSAERVRQVGVRLADALAAVHACGVLHRDVRPANVLIHHTGMPGLIDFGLAAVGGASATADTVLVTSTYAPPEALRGERATAHGDVFSLAATLYALLTGGPPARPGTDRVSLDVHWSLMEALRPALSDDPADRPTAAGFRDQLAKTSLAEVPSRPAAAAPVEAPPAVAAVTEPTVDEAGPDEAPPSGTRRRTGIVALVAVLVTLVGATSVWFTRGSAPSADPVLAAPSTATSAAPSPTLSAATAADGTRPSGQQAGAIRLQGSTSVAKPFQTVRIEGMYEGGASTFVRVQRWEAGKWRAFPLPTKTEPSGQLTAFVELGQPGRHRIRVLDPDSGVTSDPFVLVIKA